MDKKIAGLLGAVAAFTSLDAAQATSTPSGQEALRVNSYAELLEPVPNAVQALVADDAARATSAASPDIRVAENHHHHHHQQQRHRRSRHHHHHHSMYIRTPRSVG